MSRPGDTPDLIEEPLEFVALDSRSGSASCSVAAFSWSFGSVDERFDNCVADEIIDLCERLLRD